MGMICSLLVVALAAMPYPEFSPRYQSAMGHFQDGDVELALGILRDLESEALDPLQKAVVAYSIGRCLQKAGRYTEARTFFEAALKLPPKEDPELTGRARRSLAEVERARLASLEVQCPFDTPVMVTLVDKSGRRLVPQACNTVFEGLEPGVFAVSVKRRNYEWPLHPIELAEGSQGNFEVRAPGTVTVSSSLSESLVRIDDVALGSAPVRALTLPPGRHEIFVQAESAIAPWSQTVDVVSGKHTEVRAALEPRPPPERVLSGWAWLIGGATVAALVSGSVLGWQASESYDRAESYYARYRLVPYVETEVWKSRTQRQDERTDLFAAGSVASFALAGLGGAALVWLDLTGGLFTVRPSIQPKGPAGVSLQIVLP